MHPVVLVTEGEHVERGTLAHTFGDSSSGPAPSSGQYSRGNSPRRCLAGDAEVHHARVYLVVLCLPMYLHTTLSSVKPSEQSDRYASPEPSWPASLGPTHQQSVASPLNYALMRNRSPKL